MKMKDRSSDPNTPLWLEDLKTKSKSIAPKEVSRWFQLLTSLCVGGGTILFALDSSMHSRQFWMLDGTNTIMTIRYERNWSNLNAVSLLMKFLCLLMKFSNSFQFSLLFFFLFSSNVIALFRVSIRNECKIRLERKKKGILPEYNRFIDWNNKTPSQSNFSNNLSKEIGKD